MNGIAEARERLRQKAQNEQTVVELNRLLSDVQAERDQARAEAKQLREKLRGQQDDYAVGAAIQRAAGELPDGYEIHLEVERGAGTVRLYDPSGDEVDGIEGDTIADEIIEAISIAKGEHTDN